MSARGTIRQAYLHLLSFALLAMGIISLAGFLQLTQPDRHNVVLLPDSALTAILIGIAFLATAHERRWLRRAACALAVGVLGYGILHNLLAGSADNGLSLLSGFLRMRTPLAVLLLLVVLGIVAATGPRPARRLALLVAALCTGYGLLAQLAMWNPALSVFPAGFKPASALIANLFLVLLGLGVAALASGPVSRAQTPDALTMVAGACGAVLTCSAWYLASAQSAEAISRESSLLRQRTAAAITRSFDNRSAMLARLQERWSRSQAPQQFAGWETEAQAYVRDYSDIDMLALLDAQRQPQRHTGHRGTLPPTLASLLARASVQQFLTQAGRQPHPSVSAVQDIGGRSLQLLATPLALASGETWLMLAVIDTSDLLSPLMQHNLRGVSLGLRSADVRDVFGRQDGATPHLVTGSTDIALANGPRWQLVSGIDTPQTLLGLTYLPALIMAGGLALTFLLMLCQHLAWLAMGRAREEKRARRALELSLGTQRQVQELNLRIMELSQDILCTLDRNGRILDISPSCQNIFGHSQQVLRGQRLIDHIHPEDRQATLEHSRRVVRGMPVRGFRSRILRQDGHSADMLWSAAWSAHDQLMLVSGHDISELIHEKDMSAAQQDILEQIAGDAPLASALAACCRLAERLLPGARVLIGHAVMPDDPIETVSSGPPLPAAGDDLQALLSRLLADPAGSAQPAHDGPLQLLPLTSRGNERIGAMLIHDSAAASGDARRAQALARVSHLAAIAIERLRDRQQLAHSEQHFRSLYDANPDAIFFLDHAGRLRDMNDSACALMGWERARDAGRNSEDLLPVPFADWVLSQIAQGGDCQPARFDQTVYIAPRRCMLHLDVSAFPVHSGSALHGVFCLAKDVTAQRNAIDELHLYRRCLESSYNGVIIADARQPDLPIVYVNPAFERITGYSRREAQGRNCRFLQGNDTTQEALEEVRRGLVEGRDIHVIVRNFRKDGTQFWNDLYITPIRNEKGEITHFAGVQNDISEKRRFENQISFSSSHDVLTGLPNRTLLEDRLRQGCQFSRRYQRRLAVIYVDLDGFKPVNDSLGHLTGDQLLKEAGRRLQDQVRPGDTVARMGADEFILLLPDLACEEDVIPVVERVSRSLRQPFRLAGNEIHLSASMGISCSDGTIDEPLQLIQQADLAMYKAKQEGKNNYQWYTNDLNQKVSERLALRNLIQVALDGDEFRLRFQPQIEGRSGRIIGLEAQVSWMSSDDSMLPAGDFLPIAEETGQIIPISQWMLDSTCDCIRQLRARNIAVPVFGIRISPVYFQRSHFVQDLIRCLGRHGVEAGDLELEIRETTLLQGREQTIDKLNELKRLGFRLAIDNFGTGFSSLGHLKTLPVDKVKLDRSLIREVISDRHDAAMMQAIISIAHHLQLRVAADGVDTEPQFSFLVKNMCDEFQGSYFSPAMNFELVESLLASTSHLRNPEPLSAGEHRPTVLLLDDEENILRALTRVLRRDGYQILTAQRARDAFDLLARNEVQVIISDQRMPDMSGTDFLSQVKDIYPETIRIVLSGFTDLKSVTDAINQGAIYRFLTKPWDDDELRQHVAEAFRRHAAGQRGS